MALINVNIDLSELIIVLKGIHQQLAIFNQLYKKEIIHTVKIEAHLDNIAECQVIQLSYLDKLTSAIGPRRPGKMSLSVIGEDNTMLKCIINLPALSAPDVVQRELTIQVNENEPILQILTEPKISNLTSYPFGAEHNDTVKVSLVDIDEAGNRSEPSEGTFTAKDTIAPQKPGELSITTVSEDFE